MILRLTILAVIGLAFIIVGAAINSAPLSVVGGVVLGFCLGQYLALQAARDISRRLR